MVALAHILQDDANVTCEMTPRSSNLSCELESSSESGVFVGSVLCTTQGSVVRISFIRVEGVLHKL